MKYYFFRDKNITFFKQYPLKLMSGNKWWSGKVGAKLLSVLVIFSTHSSEIPLTFHDSVQVMLVKYFMYFLAGITTEWIWNIPQEKHFSTSIIINLFNLFFDIALSVFKSLFNSFSFDVTSFSLLLKCFIYEINKLTTAC